ncbi:uncharacterized protein LOC116261488 [Nymphaea colorata]|nr:uncharacterized protein LOC116261488 [Nymphaea colorata]XP_031496129.1 uncharacterized protein LOC116261488 [Nymphaea colorata]
MGSVVSTVADGAGSALGTLISAPIKTIFGGSCENICVGTWDIFCFIEHFCISNLVKVAMVSLLIYILMLFFYLLYQIGIVQCIGRSICKMTWACCETYWFAVEDISCFLWHKLRNAKRVYHRRRDLEAAYSSSDDEEEDDDDSVNNYESLRVAISKKRPLKDRRKNRIRSSLKPRNHWSGSWSKHSRKHADWKTKVGRSYERAYRY